MIQKILKNGNRSGMTLREITEMTDLKQHQIDFQMQKLIKSKIVLKSEDRVDGAYLYKLASYDDIPSPVIEPPVDCSPVRLDNVIKHLNTQKESVNAGAPIKTSEAVNSPSHYNAGKVECIDAIESMLTPEEFIGFLRGNILKYQWRYNHKNGAEDMKKAEWYFNKLKQKLGV